MNDVPEVQPAAADEWFVKAEEVQVGAVRLRDLRVVPEDWVEIRWPFVPSGCEEKRLLEFLTGRPSFQDGVVRVAASAAHNGLALRRRLPWLRDVRPRRLRRECAPELLDLWDAFATSDRRWADPVSHLPGNPRKLISMLLAMGQSRFFVFDTVGVDGTGERQVEELVDEVRKRGWGFLQLVRTFPDLEIHRR